MTEDRSARASAAKLRLFAIWAEELLEILRDQTTRYDDIKRKRDSLTRWAPWAINLPLWNQLHGDLSKPQRESALKGLVTTRDALQSVLSGKPVAVPQDYFGDVSQDVKSLTVST